MMILLAILGLAYYFGGFWGLILALIVFFGAR
jgi:hypothetical protein